MFGMGTGGPSAIKSPTPRLLTLFCISNELFSRTVASQVSSPRQSLTSVFGMGTGGPSAVISLIVTLKDKINFRNYPSQLTSIVYHKERCLSIGFLKKFMIFFVIISVLTVCADIILIVY